MEYFVNEDSIVREIWGKSDTILFIFAGASAEFALNKSVDWLYFTGRLPADPLGRLFSTVAYARQIIFSPYTGAIAAIDQITAIHQGVEQSRGQKIPDWAYRDVLFMLIDYSIRSFELLERKLTLAEKEEVFAVFSRVGLSMHLEGLPSNFGDWEKMRATHLANNLVHSPFSADLYLQYQKHLGRFRFWILKEGQILVLPEIVRQMLALRDYSLLTPAIWLYKIIRVLQLDTLFKTALLPPAYKNQILAMDYKL